MHVCTVCIWKSVIDLRFMSLVCTELYVLVSILRLLWSVNNNPTFCVWKYKWKHSVRRKSCCEKQLFRQLEKKLLWSRFFYYEKATAQFFCFSWPFAMMDSPITRLLSLSLRLAILRSLSFSFCQNEWTTNRAFARYSRKIGWKVFFASIWS